MDSMQRVNIHMRWVIGEFVVRYFEAELVRYSKL